MAIYKSTDDLKPHAAIDADGDGYLDTFQNLQVDSEGKEIKTRVQNAFAITPDDDNDLTNTTIGIYVGVSGNLKVTLSGGTTVTFTDLVAGVFHPICATRVYATDTDADSIIGVY